MVSKKAHAKNYAYLTFNRGPGFAVQVHVTPRQTWRAKQVGDHWRLNRENYPGVKLTLSDYEFHQNFDITEDE